MLTLFERLTLEQLPFYVHSMKYLAARGMSVPDPVANADGAILHSLKARPAVVVNRLPGESETEPTAAHCSSVGEFLARLHLTGLDYHDDKPIRGASNGGTRSNRWSAAAYLTDSACCSRVN